MQTEKITDNPLSLRVVPIKDVLPHEHIDLRRVKLLADKLKKASLFTNPPIVMESGSKYVVLDGATRVTCFKELNYEHIIVQVMSENDDVVLDKWAHAIRKINIVKLFEILKNIPEISIIKNPANQADNLSGLCNLYTPDNKVYSINPAKNIDKLDALNEFTNTYIQHSHVNRTVETNMDMLLKSYEDLCCLVVFPKFTIKEVLEAPIQDKILPPGITRFLISGRLLRLNADFNYLKSNKSLTEKRDWLNKLVMEKLASESVRYYKEPVYILDE